MIPEAEHPLILAEKLIACINEERQHPDHFGDDIRGRDATEHGPACPPIEGFNLVGQYHPTYGQAVRE